MRRIVVSRSSTDWLVGLACAAAVAFAAPVRCQDGPAPIEERHAERLGLEGRLARIERAISGEGLLDLANQVAQLRREVSLMRGEIENQAFLIDRLRETQTELYLKLEGRPAAQGQAPLDLTGGAAESVATARPAAEGEATAPSRQRSQAPSPVSVDDSQIALTGPVTPAASTAGSAEEAEAVKAAYQAAFDLLKAGEYVDAVAAFRAFIAEHPNSDYADNAQYWLGEAFYVTDDYTQAIAEYEKLLTAYPRSQKLTHALLKIGYSQAALGDTDAARATLTVLTREHPNTTAARLAQERLEQMPQPESAEG